MYSEHLDNSVTDIVTNIEQVKIQRILNGSHSLNDFGIVSSSKRITISKAKAIRMIFPVQNRKKT